MKLTLSEVSDFYKFYDLIINQEIAFSTAYKLNKLSHDLASDVEFLRKKIQSIAEEYALKDEDGKMVSNENGSVQINPEKLTECQQKLDELSNIEVEVNTEFSLEEFNSLAMPPSALNGIIKLIKIDAQ